jgi:hypothetical protein
MQRKRAFALLTVFAFVFGCTTAQVNQANANLQKFLAFTVKDAQAALADAIRVGDKPGAQCWTGVGTILGSAQAQSLAQVPQIVGLATAIQAGRDLKYESQAIKASADDINMACAAMIVDSKVTIAALAARVAPLFGTQEQPTPAQVVAGLMERIGQRP